MKYLKDIFWRLYLVYFLMLSMAVAVVCKLVYVQFAEGDKWEKEARSQTTGYKDIEAVRGNIYSSEGNLLATSIPIFEIRMDPNTDALTDEIFHSQIDSLAYCLSKLFKDKSTSEWKMELVRARKSGERFHLIRRKVRFNELKKIKSFPLFRMGKYKGGLIVLQQNKRERPFRLLAARTIGYERKHIKPVGLEGAFSNELRGINGRQLMKKIAGGVWMPIDDENSIEPEDGSDIITTININFQDVAEQALLKMVRSNHADHGCAVLMEVSTGEVLAIANLSKDADGDYYEYYNYAIGESTEPGSTFKLASLIAALEDNRIQMSDSVDTENGRTEYYDAVMTDSHQGGYGKISVKRAFEVSSNVGISKLIYRSYWKDPQTFVDRLYAMKLNEPLGIKIMGEGKPLIKSTSDASWSGITLPWMSIGYEVRLTPLQILTFYNAIANHGRMVKPMFVKMVMRKGKVIKRYRPVIIKESICSESTLAAAREMLEGVVLNGTARNLKNAHYKIAGKTGTAQIANTKYGYRYNSKVSYQASFVGYFPADRPKYSCIVVINAPTKDVYYGNQVAGPVFKEIADKVYASSIEIQEPLEKRQFADGMLLPVPEKGSADMLLSVLNELQTEVKPLKCKWVKAASTATEAVELSPLIIHKASVPDVTGMPLNDAVYLLENLGLNVRVKGMGKVAEQSVPPGTKISEIQEIILKLS